MHIVLLRFSSLGDVVMQTGFVSWLKFISPKIKITFITSTECGSLLRNHPHIDTLIEYKKEKGTKDLKKLRTLGKEINANEKIDFIIDLHGTTRAFFFKFLNPSIPAMNLDKRRLERFLLVKFKIDLLKNSKKLHERNINDLLGLIAKDYNQKELSDFLNKASEFQNHFGITSSPLSFTDTFIGKKPFDKYIVISPVASFSPKRWPIEKYKQLIEKILSTPKLNEFGVCIIAGPNDNYCDDLNSLQSRFPMKFLNLKGKTSLIESSLYIRQAEAVIGNDTGMGHIAESFGVPVVSIFGPTSESFGFSPFLEQSQTVSVNLWCRPCSTTGKKKCFRKRQYCMEDVTISDVFNKLLMTLEKSNDV